MRHTTLPNSAHGLHPSRSIPVRLGGVETIVGSNWYKTYGLHVCAETSNIVLSLVYTALHGLMCSTTLTLVRLSLSLSVSYGTQLYNHIRNTICAGMYGSDVQY